MANPPSSPLPLIGRTDRNAARRLVEGCGLRFLETVDDLLGLFEDGRLIGCGARIGRVLAMLVIAPGHRGCGLVGAIIGELMRRGCEAGCGGFFIFTRPCTAPAFAQLGFRPLVEHDKAVLLEHGNELHAHLRRQAVLTRHGRNAAVVIDADPFSLADRHLIEHAAAHADTVYVLVPGEGPFVLPPADRLELARRGTAHLAGAVVVDAGPYDVVPATFPAYFLTPGDQPDRIAREIGADLFGRHIGPFFSVATRVVGTGSSDPAENDRNQALSRRLEPWGVRLVQVERPRIAGGWMDAAHVRGALARGDRRQAETCLPPSTLALLDSRAPGPAAWRRAA